MLTYPSYNKTNKQPPSDFPTFLHPCYVSVDRESVKDVTIVTKDTCIAIYEAVAFLVQFVLLPACPNKTNKILPPPSDFPTFLQPCHVSADRESVKNVTIVKKDICITIYGAVAFLVQFVLLPAPYNSAEM